MTEIIDLIALRTKMGFTIRASQYGASADRLVLIQCDETNSTLQRMDRATFDAEGFESVFLRHWRAVTGFNPFTIVSRRKGKYKAEVLSFVPAGKTVKRIKGRNGRYAVQYA